ncbi:MAG: thioredoxin family protein [Sulfuricella sp.]
MKVKLANGLLAIILAWFPAAGAHVQDKVEIPLARDFTLEATNARTKNLPILVMFSQHDCAFCTQVLQEFLLPMRRNAEYESKVIMRLVDVGSSAPLRTFTGKATTHARFARENRIKLTPTIKLFDAQGHELTEPLIGLSTPDYYGGFLDQRIDEALAKVRAGK